MMPTLDIYCGDAAHKLVNVGTESVQLVVTSPPYDNLRDGAYEVILWETFTAIALELYRVLVPGGIVCWNVCDSVQDGSETLTSFRQAIYFKEVCGFRVHDTMIYEKTNFGHPERRRYHNLFEYIFVLSKGEPRCFNPIKDKPNAWAGTGPFGVSTMRNRNGTQVKKKANIIAEFGMRSNVWRCKTAGQENVCTEIEHPAVMPSGLCRDLILSWSNVGDTVLDPMCGSGTTLKQSMLHGRNAIGIDKNRDYCAMAKQTCDITPGLQLA